jgi:uncharacterized membrane protein YbhN (UPF0104 family)
MSWRRALAAWLFAVLALAAVLAVIAHFSELREFGVIVRNLRPAWFIVVAALQALTYICAAIVWELALAHEGFHRPLRTLVPMALAMLFANQAMPSAGLAGGAVVVRGLTRRKVPANVVMGALLVGLFTTYAAYLIAVLVGLAILGFRAESRALLSVLGGFAVAAVGIPAALAWYRHSLPPRARARIVKIPGVGTLLEAIAAAPNSLLHDVKLLASATCVQLAEFILDAMTLSVILVMTHTEVAPALVFACFAVASAVARVVPVPLGLGSFEGALTGMLHVAGVPLEAALAATLLLRGFTLWLPMAPGLWCARRELWD